MKIPRNSVAAVVISDAQTVASYFGSLNASDVIGAVSAYLAATGKYLVEAADSSGALLSTITPLIQETFQATFKVQLNYDLDTSEIASDFQTAFSTVTGQTPSQITIPNYSGSGSIHQTGQAQPTSTTTQSIGDAISGFFGGVASTTKSLLIGAVAIVVLVLILIAYGPNVKHIAAAV